jgi:SP family arabinose:H+ symporter-like MFS transporter
METTSLKNLPASYSRAPLIIAASVSTLGGLLFGYDNIVISGAIGYLSQLFQLNAAGIGWAAGCALVGCIAGCAAAGTIADYLGKKKGLALCAICFALSSVGMMFAASLHQFVFWRLIGGLGIGAASVISPNYIAEIAPTPVRGRCVTLYQLGIVVGILAAVFVNMLIQRMGNEAWNISTGWRLMFLAGVVPAVLFGLMIIPAVESPRWLMKVGCRDRAIAILSKINGSAAAHKEAAEIEDSLAVEDGHISELFTTFRRPLLLGIMLAGLQQISGITPLFSFLPEIFRSAGTATGDAFFQSVLVSIINLLFTLFALWLVDRAGRKTLILAGTTLQFISLALVGWFYHIHGSGLAVLILVMSFVAGHAFGNGVSNQSTRARHVYRHNRTLGGRLPRESDVSLDAERSWIGRHVLVVQRGCLVDDYSCQLADPRNEGAFARRNYKILDGREIAPERYLSSLSLRHPRHAPFAHV